MRRKRFDHDDDCFDAFSSASQHEPRQTRIGSLDIRRMQDRRLAFRGGRRGTPNATPGTGRATGFADSGELGLAPIAGAALLRLASSAKANPRPMPELPESAAAKVKKKPKSMTHRPIEVPSSETICRTAKNFLAEPVATKVPHCLFFRIIRKGLPLIRKGFLSAP
jgi:hypothetical protein